MPRLAGVNHLDAVRALEKAGFHIRRQGKHIVMTERPSRPGSRRGSRPCGTCRFA
jgi:hypothetical protein